MTISNHSNFGPHVPETRRIAHIRRLLAEINMGGILPPNPTDEDLKVVGATLIKVANSMGVSEEELGVGRAQSLILTSGPKGRDVTARAMEMYHNLMKEDKSRQFIVLDSIPPNLNSKGKVSFQEWSQPGPNLVDYTDMLSRYTNLLDRHHYPTVVNIAFPGKEEEAVTTLKDEKAKLEDVTNGTSKLSSILKQSLKVKNAKTQYDNVKKGKRHGRTKP